MSFQEWTFLGAFGFFRVDTVWDNQVCDRNTRQGTDKRTKITTRNNTGIRRQTKFGLFRVGTIKLRDATIIFSMSSGNNTWSLGTWVTVYYTWKIENKWFLMDGKYRCHIDILISLWRKYRYDIVLVFANIAIPINENNFSQNLKSSSALLSVWKSTCSA